MVIFIYMLCARVFSEEIEHELIEYVEETQNRFNWSTVTDVRSVAFQLEEHNGLSHRFSMTQKLAVHDWASSFMKRHKLSLRTDELTSVLRLTGINRIQVTRFFDNRRDALSKYAFKIKCKSATSSYQCNHRCPASHVQ